MQASQAYLDTHGIQKAVEDVINSAVKHKPENPIAFMASWACGLVRTRGQQTDCRSPCS